jgi:hypothetical protein
VSFQHPQIKSRFSLKGNYFFWGLTAAILCSIYLHWQFQNAFPLSPDEAIHLVWIRLISAGYAPYSQVYISYPPLYPLFLMASWAIAPSLEGLRWLSYLYALISVLAAAVLARRMDGPVAGIAAAFFYALAPQFVLDSSAVMGETPSIAWSLLAVWLALRYRDRSQKLPLILSGLCMSFSLMTKVLSPFMAVLCALIIASAHIRNDQPRIIGWRSILRESLIWGAALLVPFLIAFLIVDRQAFINQVIGQRLSARAVYVQDTNYWGSRLERLGQFALDNIWSIPLALLGLWLSFRNKLNERKTYLLWLALAVMMLLIHEPIRTKHYAILLPLLAIWAGVSVSQAVKGWSRFNAAPWKQKLPAMVIPLLLAGYLCRLPLILQAWESGRAEARPTAEEAAALDFLRKTAAPDDCLITDDMQVAYWSGLLVPPELAEVSTNRLKAGELTTGQMVEITERYQCHVAAALSNRFHKYLPDYMDWLRQNYLGRVQNEEDEFFTAKKHASYTPPQPLPRTFADAVDFLGYSFAGENAKAGARLPLVLYWSVPQKIQDNLAVFVQLRDASGRTSLSADHQPAGGLAPTSQWEPGGVIKDVLWLELPTDLAAQDYSLFIGLYHPDTMERLILGNDQSGENALLLTRFKIN